MRARGESFKIGEVYLIEFPGSDHEQYGLRPGLVIQNNVGNIYSPNIIALPFTSSIKKLNQPTHVLVGEQDGLRKKSMILCESPTRVSKSKVGKYITTLSNDTMAKVAKAYLLASSIMVYLSPDRLSEIREESIVLNDVT